MKPRAGDIRYSEGKPHDKYTAILDEVLRFAEERWPDLAFIVAVDDSEARRGGLAAHGYDTNADFVWNFARHADAIRRAYSEGGEGV